MLQAPGLVMSLVLATILVVGNGLALFGVHGSANGTFGPHSGLVGVHTAATRSSDAAWLAANRAAWPWALALNGGAIFAAIVGGVLGNTVAPFIGFMAMAVLLSLAAAVAQIVIGHRAAQRELGERD